MSLLAQTLAVKEDIPLHDLSQSENGKHFYQNWPSFVVD